MDVRETASACRRVLEPVAGADWDSPAGDLEWSCRATLGHLLSALLYYAINLTLRSTEPRPSGQADPSPPGSACASTRRGSSAHGVLGRLFPWAPRDQDSWEALRWAHGRAPLGERPRLAPDWVAHPAPLQEWDGGGPQRLLLTAGQGCGWVGLPASFQAFRPPSRCARRSCRGRGGCRTPAPATGPPCRRWPGGAGRRGRGGGRTPPPCGPAPSAATPARARGRRR